MSQTINIYPTTTAHNYWRGSSYTQLSPYTLAYAGPGSTYTYFWPVPFDLSAYANKIFIGLTFFAYLDVDSNNFTGSEYIGVGLAASNNSAADMSGCMHLGNEHLPTKGTMNQWNVADAWASLKAGQAYLVVYSDQYSVLATNYGTVPTAHRPYLQLVYDEGTVDYKAPDGVVHQCEVYYKASDGVHRVIPYYKASDGVVHQIST